jgi:hypothetical protein
MELVAITRQQQAPARMDVPGQRDQAHIDRVPDVIRALWASGYTHTSAEA